MTLDLEAGREREEVEGPLVAVYRLRRLGRTDLDHLREMQLVARRVIGEDAVERAEHERVGRQFAKAGERAMQRAGAARVAAREVVAAGLRGGQVRLELVGDAIEEARRREPFDDHAAGITQLRFDIVDVASAARRGTAMRSGTGSSVADHAASV